MKTKFARDVDCPTCGATPCRQKWKPRKTVDVNEMAVIEELNPVDAVHCHKCDLVFASYTSNTTIPISRAGTSSRPFLATARGVERSCRNENLR